MSLLIRSYRDDDTAQVKELHVLALKAAFGYFEHGHWDEDLDHIPEIYFNKGEFLVGELDGKIIAMGALKKISDEIGEIKRMRVHPDFQRKGLGQQMYDTLEKKARELGYKTLHLDTTVNQTPAQRFYLKNGYTEVRREKEGYPIETIFYKKHLL